MPRLPWTSEKLAYFEANIGEMTTKEMAAKIDISYSAICYMKKKLGKKSKHERDTGISYKKALPKEKWDACEIFLSALSHYGKEAHRQGVDADVGSFIKEYMKTYGEVGYRHG